MDGKRVRAVACGSTHTACLVTRAWVSDDLIKNCMACKSRFSLVNRKVRVIKLLSIDSHETRGVTPVILGSVCAAKVLKP